MGTRIEFYAVDVPQFRQFLEKSLADALRFAARSGSRKVVLWFHTSSGRYLASPDHGILFDDLQGRGQGYCRPTEAELDADPSLAITCQQHLALSDAAQLGTLFRVLADSDTIPWVHVLSRGYYWWWVCSLLDGLQHADVLGTSDREHYEALFMRVLRGVGCGKPLRRHQTGQKRRGFPVIPKRQDEHWEMGFWTAEDVELFVQCTNGLLTSRLSFGCPADLEIHRITDWNEWGREMLRQLLEIERLGYARPNLVSFIG